MNLRFTNAQDELRSEVRKFLEVSLPEHWRGNAFIFQSESEWQVARSFDQLVANKNWLTPSWPREYGGIGFGPVEQMILDEEFALAGAPDGGGRAHGPHFVGPALIKHGSAEQKQRFLPGIVSGKELWAQCFSEPDAGSDMANVSTTAIRDGDVYILNGTKVWTGQGHRAEYAVVTARTSDGPKHRSISLFIVPLSAEGVTINPIWTLPDNGRLNEEVFEDVRVPTGNLIGEVDGGWRVMLDVMDDERSSIAGAAGLIRNIKALTSELELRQIRVNQIARHQLVELRIVAEILRLVNYHVAGQKAKGRTVGEYSALTKLLGASAAQTFAQIRCSVLGMSAIGTDLGNNGLANTPWAPLLQSVQASIVSGSSEIMKNILATRRLGLPRG